MRRGRPRYLGDSVYGALRQAILTEGDLSRRFGVSRTPVCEALAKLERDHLVRVVPKKGNTKLWQVLERLREEAASTSRSSTPSSGPTSGAPSGSCDGTSGVFTTPSSDWSTEAATDRGGRHG